MKTFEQYMADASDLGKEISYNDFAKEIKTGKYELATHDGLPDKYEDSPTMKFYKNDGAVMAVNFNDDGSAKIFHIESVVKGKGKLLIDLLKDICKNKKITLTAQTKGVIPYYEKQGFTLDVPGQYKDGAQMTYKRK